MIDKRPDNVLLKEFCSHPDKDGFAVLMQRHGPVVRAAARSVIGDTIALDDIVQATFITLARKAAHLQKDRSLASWLYHVSICLARNERRNEKRRKSREESAVMESGTNTEIPEALKTQWALLHESIDALPEKFRAPIILYHMEGCSYSEGAAQLGLTEKTFSSRLSRARELLKSRIGKHGAALSVAALFTAFNESMAVEIPSALISTTTSAAKAIVAGNTVATGLVSAKVAAMTKTALELLFWTKAKAVIMSASVALVAAILALTIINHPAEKSQLPEAVKDAAGKEGMIKVSITPRQYEAGPVFSELARKKLLVYIMHGSHPLRIGNAMRFRVPPKLRYQETDAVDLIEAIANYSSMHILWKPEENCCILYRGISDKKLNRLKKDLTHADISVRAEAVWRAGWYNDIRVVPLLLSLAEEKALESQLRVSLRKLNWAAVIALDKRGWRFADAELSHANKDVRANAIYTFCSKGDESSIAYLKKAIEDTHLYVRAAARETLAQIGGGDMVRFLGKELNKHGRYSSVLIQTLGLIGGKEAFSLLEQEWRKEIAEKPLKEILAYSPNTLEAICQTGDERVYAVAEEALKELPWNTYVLRGLSILARRGDSRARSLLLKTLHMEIEVEQARAGEFPGVRRSNTYWAALRTLGEIGDEKAIPLIEESLMKNNYRGGLVEMNALVGIGGRSAFRVIKKALNSSKLRAEAVKALGKVAEEGTVPLLEKALRDKDQLVRKNALDALDMIGGEKSVSSIIRLLKDEDALVQNTAVDTLLRGFDKDLIATTLNKTLKSENMNNRIRATQCIGANAHIIDVEEAVALLEEAVEDKSDSVVTMAIGCLGGIGGDKAVTLLIKALTSNRKRLQSVAAQMLVRPTFDSHRDRIIKALQSQMKVEKIPYVRSVIARELKKLEMKPQDVF